MILTQLVRADILARLTDSQLQILNSVVEAELVQNASIRRLITPVVQTGTRGLQGVASASSAKASAKKSSKKGK
jgi:hypothetical protein